MGAEKLQQTAWESYGVRLSRDEAVQHRATWFQLYPGIKAWHEAEGKRLKMQRTVEARTLYGRRRVGIDRLPEALNTPVQGTGADGLKLALARLFEHRDEVPRTRLINVVHDEILAECPADEAEETARWLQTHMEAAMQAVVDGQVPTPVEVKIGQSWAG
jgi:DNA polymerase I